MRNVYLIKLTKPILMSPSSLIFQEFSRYDDDSVMIAFRGDMSENLLNSLLLLAEEKLNRFHLKRPTRKKAFHILVECIQNVHKHAGSSENRSHSTYCGNGMIIMTATSQGVRIATGNNISRFTAEELEDRLNQIDQMGPEALRESYKEQLVHGKLSEHGGAGLGFIDIARKSGAKIDYGFAPIDDHRLFFTFNVQVA